MCPKPEPRWTTLCFPAVPCHPRRLPPSSAVFRCRLPSPVVPRRPPPPPTTICLRSWGLSSFLMTAVLEIQGRGRTAFCRPVQSFSQVARQVGKRDEDGLLFAIPSRPGRLAVPLPGMEAVLATVQSFRHDRGRGWTTVGRPIQPFFKVARQVGMEDEDRRHLSSCQVIF